MNTIIITGAGGGMGRIAVEQLQQNTALLL